MYYVPPNSAVFYVFAVKIQGSHFPSSTYVLFIDCNFTLSTAWHETKPECRARFVSSTHADHDFSARAVATRPTRWETEVGFELDLEPRGWKENSGIFFLKRPDLPAHPSLPPKTSQAVAPLLRYLSPWMMDEAAVLNSYSSEWAPVERRWGIVVPAGCWTPTSTPGDAWRGGECAFSLQEYGI